MTGSPRLITRIALFSALFYVLSWGTALLPNVNLGFLLAFSAGYLWGVWAGVSVGLVGMSLWTFFNPLGPAALPIAAAQVGGMAACGALGAAFHPLIGGLRDYSKITWIWLVAAGIACGLAFYLPVSIVDAWVFQPFWPRIIAGLAFTGVSLVVNAFVFPLLFGITRLLYAREHGSQ